jgi:oligopeptide transport system substrate-binding protein
MNRLIPSAALALAIAVAGCGGGQRKDDVPVVVSAIGGAPSAGDPSRGALGFPQRVLMDATAQGLVRFDAAGQIEPGLAERWIVIDDGRSYIFRLREAQWPDGQPVTAEQVVRALRRAAAPRSGNALAPFLAVIDEIVEMTPQVIEIRLKRSRPDLLKLFAQPELAVFRETRLDGSGPFRGRGERGAVTLVPLAAPGADEDAAPLGPERAVRLYGERAAVALARLRAGKSDLILGGSFADWPILTQVDLPAGSIQVDPATGLFGLAVLRREGFLESAENRAALAMAIDRPALTQAVKPDWAPTETLLPAALDSAGPPAEPAWIGLAMPARIAEARARVQAWRRAHPEPVVVRIALPAGPGATLVWGHVAAALLRIGLQPQRVPLGSPAELALVDQVAPYDSGRWFVQTACVSCSDEAAALIAAAREAPDLTARAQRIAEADAALTADVAFIPLAQPLRWSVVTPRLGAWQRNTRAWHPLNHLRNETE